MTIDGSANPVPALPVRGRMSKFILFMLIALCVLFIASYTNRSAKRAQVEEQIRHWERRIELEEQKQVALQAELEYIVSADYLDEVAREELNLHKEGDTVIVVLPNKTASSIASGPDDQSSASDSGAGPSDETMDEGHTATKIGGEPATGEPIWRQWLSLFAVDAEG